MFPCVIITVDDTIQSVNGVSCYNYSMWKLLFGGCKCSMDCIVDVMCMLVYPVCGYNEMMGCLTLPYVEYCLYNMCVVHLLDNQVY